MTTDHIGQEKPGVSCSRSPLPRQPPLAGELDNLFLYLCRIQGLTYKRKTWYWCYGSLLARPWEVLTLHTPTPRRATELEEVLLFTCRSCVPLGELWLQNHHLTKESSIRYNKWGKDIFLTFCGFTSGQITGKTKGFYSSVLISHNTSRGLISYDRTLRAGGC